MKVHKFYHLLLVIVFLFLFTHSVTGDEKIPDSWSQKVLVISMKDNSHLGAKLSKHRLKKLEVFHF